MPDSTGSNIPPLTSPFLARDSSQQLSPTNMSPLSSTVDPVCDDPQRVVAHGFIDNQSTRVTCEEEKLEIFRKILLSMEPDNNGSRLRSIPLPTRACSDCRLFITLRGAESYRIRRH